MWQGVAQLLCSWQRSEVSSDTGSKGVTPSAALHLLPVRAPSSERCSCRTMGPTLLTHGRSSRGPHQQQSQG